MKLDIKLSPNKLKINIVYQVNFKTKSCMAKKRKYYFSKK